MKKIMLLLFVLLMTEAALFAQGVDCPQNYNGTGWQKNQHANYGYDAMFPYCESDYEYKQNADGTVDVIIDWSTYESNRFLLGLNAEEQKQLIYYAILDDLWRAIPHIEGSTYFKFVEKSNCYIESICYFQLLNELSILCEDQGWNPLEIQNHLISINGTKYLKKIQYINCGQKCCNVIVEVNYNPNNSYDPEIVNITSAEYPGTFCSPGIDSDDCKTGLPKTCWGNCSLDFIVR